MIALLLSLAATASAAPTPNPTPPDEGSGNQLQTLRSNLESAAIGYLEANDKLQAALTKQKELGQALTVAELDKARMKVGVAKYAAEVYRTGRLGVLGVMLNSRSQDAFMQRAEALDRMTQRDQAKLAELVDAERRATEAKTGIDQAVKEQQAAITDIEQRKLAAERALSSLGGWATKGWVDPSSPLARPAGRNADGSWPKEGCTINDPTSDGCITPRMLHAMQEAQKVGFGKYVHCFRTGDQFEHPKGRACDFSVFAGGFVNSSASGDNRLYGDKLASFMVKNAQALGVMYIVWYCQIWINGGWRAYRSAGSTCGDSPAGDHTNHVHVSIY